MTNANITKKQSTEFVSSGVFEKQKFECEFDNFKKSWQHNLSKFFALFSCVVAILCVLDFYYKNSNQKVVVQEFAEQLQDISPLDYDAQLHIANVDFRFDAHWAIILQQANSVNVCKTRWFAQPKTITVNNAPNLQISHASIYNDAIIVIALLLCFGLRIFFPFRNKFTQLLLSRYYNLLILPFLCIYTLFGNSRLQHAFEMIF